MSWITTVIKLTPVIGSLAGTVIDKLWPDRSDARQKAHEIELEELRRFHLPPKTLLRYVLVGMFALYALWIGIAAVFPHLPQPPWGLRDMLIMADTLFGLGN
ncbi:MAG: hypothetical protein LBH65_00465 [Desulfovibrio sp.]|jgi:hypothetical protein|nr:hypothetical protein [Desulfovibrio sp.]